MFRVLFSLVSWVKEGLAAVYLHATVCGVEHFLSKPLDSIWSPGTNTDSQVC